jgi:capsular polysaccharide biosynthesis protein
MMITNEAQTRWDSHRYLGALLHWLWLLALCTVIGAAGTFLVTKKLQPPIYRATTILVVDQQNAPDPTASEKLATTYANLITQPIVLQTAAGQVGHISATELAKRIQAYAQSNTALIVISADDPDPARAAVLANAVGSVAITALSQLGLAVKYPVVIFQPAVPPTAPDHPNAIQNSLVGGALGFAFAAVLIYMLDLLEGRKRTPARGAQLAELIGADNRAGDDNRTGQQGRLTDAGMRIWSTSLSRPVELDNRGD